MSFAGSSGWVVEEAARWNAPTITGVGIDIFAKIASVSVDCDEWTRFKLPLPVGFRRFIPRDRLRGRSSPLNVLRTRRIIVSCTDIRGAFLGLALWHFDRSQQSARVDFGMYWRGIFTPASKGWQVERCNKDSRRGERSEIEPLPQQAF